MSLTLEEIRQRGLKALRQELGMAGMIRFLQLFETGSGDYAKERHAWVDAMTLEQLVSLAKAKRTTKKRPGKGRRTP